MSSTNRPDKVSLDAYSDPQLQTQNGNGVYSRFTNILRTPILNAKGIQLLNANFINSRLQLDDNSQLMFFYWFGSIGNLQMVRLLPSNFIPAAGFTAFTRNRYLNSVDELVAALNTSASAGGDVFASNPLWAANAIIFSYNAASRKITVQSRTADVISPAAADDPAVIAAMASNQFTMQTIGGVRIQPYVQTITMNARLGFAMSSVARPLWGGVSSVPRAANQTGVLAVSIEADASPILLGTQNIGVYVSVVNGAGMDQTGRKNLLQTVPIEVAPLNINSYTCSSVEKPALSVPNEIYEITVDLLDDFGRPFFQPPNYNTELALAIYY